MKAIHQCVFSRVPVGAKFWHNGNTYTKKTTRTAHLEEYDRRFYFGMREWVTVNREVCKAILESESQA